MKKHGFTFIELILGVTIAAILSLVLFLAYNQTNKSVINLDKIIDLDIKVSILQNQLENDLTGIFVPDITPAKPPEQPKSNKESQEKVKKDSKESKESKEQQKQKKDAGEERKLLEKTFYSENRGKMFNELTFITCNPLQVYGQAKPRIARVIYQLKEDRSSKNSYSLYRQESNELIYGAHSDVVEYEIANNIKEFNIQFIVPEAKNKEQKKEKEKKEVKKIDTSEKFKIYNEWNFEGKNKENPFIIPILINIKITFWEDNAHTQQQSFEFKYYVYAFFSQFPKKKKSDEKLEDIFKKFETLRKEAGIKDKTDIEAKQKNQQQEKK